MTRPLLQLAIDVQTLTEAERLLEDVYPYFDIAEVGTPLILEEGMAALEALKARRPDRLYLADTKIADAGFLEADGVFRRGADIVTVLGVADNRTIEGALKAASEHSGKVMIDLIHVTNRVMRAKALDALGVHYLCLHTAYDVQSTGVDPLADLHAVRQAVRCSLAIAGGLTIDTVGDAAATGADVVVVGGGIHTQPDRKNAARAIVEKLEKEAPDVRTR